jgi:hypothetical protein
LIWRFTLVLIKINYGQIGDQTGLFYTACNKVITGQVSDLTVLAKLAIKTLVKALKIRVGMVSRNTNIFFCLMPIHKDHWP